jgi:hypothetical protein
MNDDCIEGPNECWSVYKLPEGEKKESSFGTKFSRQTGCKNIGTIGMGQKVEFSPFACQQKCENDPQCKGFLLKAKGCTASAQQSELSYDDDDDGHMCHLLKGDCEEDKSDVFACWDIHYKVNETLAGLYEHSSDRVRDGTAQEGTALGNMYILLQQYKQGDTVITISDEQCFRAGDKIKMFHDIGSFEQVYDIVSVNPVTIDPGLRKTYERGTGVMRLHHPANPTWCGDWPP